ncbi:MAG TPA: hypothetical protein VGP24_03700, partial [Glaciihabitans sp.]|nr:hypothetical protein [Glaciihabitans sp.]
MKAALTPSLRVAFPKGRHFAVTWGISDTHGGMTSALLQRSRAFVQLGGVHVDVLTFDTGSNYPSLGEKLRVQGELVDGMGLRNLWDWLRDNPSPEASASGLDLRAFAPLSATSFASATERSGRALTRNRYASDGRTVLQTDHYRLDGSLLVSDRRDIQTPGIRGGRSVVLCDETGTPVRSWTSIWALYRFWLDQLSGRSQSYFIVDSKTAANFMTSYRRPFAVTLHVVHSSHLATAERPFAPLKPSRKHVFENLASFDAVVLLTQRQR